MAEFGLADSDGIFQHSLEDWLQLAGRRTDDLENLRGRRLLLQRLGQVVSALAKFIKQPRVLDRNDGLSREVLDQVDLLIGEGTDLLPVNPHTPNENIVLEHGYNKKSTSPAKMVNRRFRFCDGHIDHLDWPLSPYKLTKRRHLLWIQERLLLLVPFTTHWRVMKRNAPQKACFVKQHIAKRRFA